METFTFYSCSTSIHLNIQHTLAQLNNLLSIQIPFLHTALSLSQIYI